MSRYIDREALLEWIEAVDGCLADGTVEAPTLYAQIITDIQQFPPPIVDVVEVRHGEWIEKDDGWDGVMYTCSVCRCDWTTIDGTPFENNMRYCPECGAKMDGERKD